jgi:hypothetical protein
VLSVKVTAKCLQSEPTDLPTEAIYAQKTHAGQYWTANEQCKMFVGANASFCVVSSLKSKLTIRNRRKYV